MAPHLPRGKASPVCSCEGLAGGEGPGTGRKEARDSFLGSRFVRPCPTGVETGSFLRNVLMRGGWGLTISGDFSQVHTKHNETICP